MCFCVWSVLFIQQVNIYKNTGTKINRKLFPYLFLASAAWISKALPLHIYDCPPLTCTKRKKNQIWLLQSLTSTYLNIKSSRAMNKIQQPYLAIHQPCPQSRLNLGLRSNERLWNKFQHHVHKSNKLKIPIISNPLFIPCPKNFPENKQTQHPCKQHYHLNSPNNKEILCP